jgi:hypothetical protein
MARKKPRKRARGIRPGRRDGQATAAAPPTRGASSQDAVDAVVSGVQDVSKAVGSAALAGVRGGIRVAYFLGGSLGAAARQAIRGTVEAAEALVGGATSVNAAVARKPSVRAPSRRVEKPRAHVRRRRSA